MIVKCTKCHHEAATRKNDKKCEWCDSPMEPIGDDYISNKDGSPADDGWRDTDGEV